MKKHALKANALSLEDAMQKGQKSGYMIVSILGEGRAACSK